MTMLDAPSDRDYVEYLWPPEPEKEPPEDLLRAGYDPEQEPGPRHTDAWLRALGWRDYLVEEAFNNGLSRHDLL